MFNIAGISRPGSVREAIALLAARPDRVVVAGGSDVLIAVREGKLAGKHLVSIRDIEELKGICMLADGALFIRPLCTFAELEENALVRAHVPTLAAAAGGAGGPQLRNVGTLGGNICNGVTSADTAPALLTLNARLELCGPGGSRSVLQEDFYRGPGLVDKAADELLVAVRIEKSDYAGFCGHTVKFAQRSAMDIATLNCAAHVKLSADKKRLEELRLAFGVAGPVPLRCRAAEQKAAGTALGPALLKAVAEAAVAETAPRESWRASRQLRTQLIGELSRRVLREAILKAGGDAG